VQYKIEEYLDNCCDRRGGHVREASHCGSK